MVAVRGSNWRLAPALEALVDETDRLFPGRSTASDGSIGDPAHAARVSDHNPDGGWVDALDLTDDDAHGCDVGLLAHHLVASRDPRVSYLIHKGTIWRGYDKPSLPAFTPQVYTGVNAHKLHLHISIDDDHRNDLGPWWPQAYPQEDDDMPTMDEIVKGLNDAAEKGELDPFFREQRRIMQAPTSTLAKILNVVKATDKHLRGGD